MEESDEIRDECDTEPEVIVDKTRKRKDKRDNEKKKSRPRWKTVDVETLIDELEKLRLGRTRDPSQSQC